MTTAAYTPEMRERNARIAVAMGTHGYFVSPAGLIYCIELPAHDALDVGYTRANDPTQIDVVGMKVPEFHTDEAARRSLLLWIDSQCRWYNFVECFAVNEGMEYAPENWSTLNKRIALATPDQVARAADAAIREGKE